MTAEVIDLSPYLKVVQRYHQEKHIALCRITALTVVFPKLLETTSSPALQRRLTALINSAERATESTA